MQVKLKGTKGGSDCKVFPMVRRIQLFRVILYLSNIRLAVCA